MQVKKVSLLMGLFLLAGCIFSQTITVVSPSAGDLWHPNVAYVVKWVKTGSMDETVKIRLYNMSGDTKIKDIVNVTPNSGSYQIQADLFNDVPGGNYIIRVRTVDNLVMGNSAVFTLVGIHQVPVDKITTKLHYLKVIKPEMNAIWKENDQYAIVFQTNLTAPLQFELLKENGRQKIVVCQVGAITPMRVDNQYSVSWKVPYYAYDEQIRYVIRISKGKMARYSEGFYIKNKVAEAVLK